jgi:rare lipoprotein A
MNRFPRLAGTAAILIATGYAAGCAARPSSHAAPMIGAAPVVATLAPATSLSAPVPLGVPIDEPVFAVNGVPAPGVLEVLTGTASYYAHALAGRRTASGERYDPQQLVAAHRSLPFGTILRVINPDNGRSVEVRVIDRGPFSPGRVIDLSRSAAEALDMVRRGVIPVRIEVLSYGN